MRELYGLVGISRQAHQQACRRQYLNKQQAIMLLAVVQSVRRDHPRMGMEKLYDFLRPPGFGRDRFIDLLKMNGLQLKRARSYHRTTYSVAHLAYDNLIHGMRVKKLNELWVSDITYFRSGDQFYYLVFIMDVYSRRIIGYNASDGLAAEANVKALRMALQLRRGDLTKGLIHHSDRGGQYVYHKYVNLLECHGIRISMGNKAWENAHAERINGTIKNDYLYPKGPVKGLKSLQRKLKKQLDYEVIINY